MGKWQNTRKYHTQESNEASTFPTANYIWIDWLIYLQEISLKKIYDEVTEDIYEKF